MADFYLKIRPTVVVGHVEGRNARLWQGTTPGGATVYVWTVWVACEDPGGQQELERELVEIGAPPDAFVVPFGVVALGSVVPL